MKVSVEWLNEILKTTFTPEDIIAVLESIGFPVEFRENKGESIQGVVIGEVLNIERHPQADRLSLCTVFDGTGEYPVVCGAPNVRQGIKAPFAKIGARLPGEVTIRSARIRGVESQGMLCSEKELGISPSAEGIMIVPESYTVGDDFSAAYGLKDTIITFEVTPNRPDVLSHIGIAREIAAAKRISLFLPKIKTLFSSARQCSVIIDASDACRRYCAQVLTGITVGSAPHYIAQRLASCGIRSINNVVDITNYVLLETGQPLHAFDYDMLTGHEIRVRFSKSNESLAALDGRSYTLSDNMLVIADAVKPAALAGIIGGESSAVTQKTKNILLEAAYFDPAIIRKTSKKLGISSESSYRFERGVDLSGLEYASSRAVDLLLMCAGGERTESMEAYPKPFVPVAVELRPYRVSQILGFDVSKETSADILNRLSFEYRGKGLNESMVFQAPSYRVDIKEEIDCIEEVARHYGYDQVPMAPVQGMIMQEMPPQSWAFSERIRRILNSAGLFETYHYGMVNDAMNTWFGYGKSIAITNPVSADYTTLRTTLIPGLLRTIAVNRAQDITPLLLYEIGAVFFNDNEKPQEVRRITGVMTGQDITFSRCKGIVELVMHQLKIAEWRIVPAQISFMYPGQNAEVFIGDMKLGNFGLLHSDITSRFNSDDTIYCFELDADLLREKTAAEARCLPLTKYPAIKRDFSFIFDRKISWEEIRREGERAVGKELLEDIIPFDRYQGKQIQSDAYGLSFTIVLRSFEKTLTDEEANAVQTKVINRLEQQLKASLRR